MTGPARADGGRPPNREERDFLWSLRLGEMVTRGDLGCVATGAERRARQSCRRRGWVTYEGRFSGWLHNGWVLTEAGRAVRDAGVKAPESRPMP